jgi:hypothetical protein
VRFSSIFDGTIHEKSLRHVGLVGFHLDQLSRSKKCGGKENGVFPFISHGNPRSVIYSAGRVGKMILLLLVPSVPKQFHGGRTVARVREGANESMKFLFSRLLEKWTTTLCGMFGVPDSWLLLG